MNNKQEVPVISLKEALLTGLILDFVLLGIASTVMDGGRLAAITFCLTAVHWAGNGYILIRRKSRMTKIDRDFIRFGLLAIICMAIVIGIIIALIGEIVTETQAEG